MSIVVRFGKKEKVFSNVEDAVNAILSKQYLREYHEHGEGD